MTALLHSKSLALVTDLGVIPDWDALAVRVTAAVRGGADLVQVRAKNLGRRAQRELASQLVVAVGGRARVVVNGDPEVAQASGADGIHLPEFGDGASTLFTDVAGARAALGPDALIGKSVHSPGAAVAAETEGADYLFFGTVFPSRSHPDAQASGVAGVAAAAGAVSIPVIGIGGITTRNCKGVIDAGASGIAVIGAILGEHDSYRAARALRNAMAGGKSHARRGDTGDVKVEGATGR